MLIPEEIYKSADRAGAVLGREILSESKKTGKMKKGIWILNDRSLQIYGPHFFKRSRYYSWTMRKKAAELDLSAIISINRQKQRGGWNYISGLLCIAVGVMQFWLYSFLFNLRSGQDFFGTLIYTLWIALGIVWIIRGYREGKREFLTVSGGGKSYGADISCYEANEAEAFQTAMKEAVSRAKGE